MGSRAAVFATVLGTVWAGIVGQGEAVLSLRLEDVGSSLGVVIQDNGPGDSSPALGDLVFFGAIPGGFVSNITIGLSNSALGGGTTGQLALTSVNVLSTGPGTLRLTLVDTDFGPGTATAGFASQVSGVLGAGPGSTLTAQSWFNPLNAVPDLGPLTAAAAPLPAIGAIPGGSLPAFGSSFVSGPGPFSSTGALQLPGTSTGPFSLFTQVAVGFTTPGVVMVTQLATASVPLPASLGLVTAALSLLGVSVAMRRRQECAGG